MRYLMVVFVWVGLLLLQAHRPVVDWPLANEVEDPHLTYRISLDTIHASQGSMVGQLVSFRGHSAGKTSSITGGGYEGEEVMD